VMRGYKSRVESTPGELNPWHLSPVIEFMRKL
jgi:hypothetical protein